MRRIRITLAFAVVGAAAFTGIGAAGGGGPAPGVALGWDGIAAPSGVRYVALAAGERTVVAVVRRNGGSIVRYGSVPGILGVPLVAFDGTPGGLSRDGRTLVLSSFTGGPEPPARTTFAIVRTPGIRLQRLVTLAGSYSFDALSPDASTLFVVEYLTANGTRYRVRMIDLRTGRLLPRVIAEKGVTTMSGQALTRAMSPDGRWAYTLYRSPEAIAFVHALDTVRRQAICIELPWRGEAQNGLEVAGLSLDPRGRMLTVRQPGVGTLATVDTRAYRVTVLRRPVAVS